MSADLAIALAPLPAWCGDLAGNAARIRVARRAAAALGADLLVTPELSLAGDLAPALRRDGGFAAQAASLIAELAAETADGGPGLLVGAPWAQEGLVHNAVFLLDGGRLVARRAQHALPRGEVFDPGPAPGPVAFRGVRIGLLIGADRDAPAVAETLAETGAELLISVNAEAFRPGAATRRVEAAVARVVETGLGFLFLNALGCQAGRVCDGAGFALNPDRALAVQLPQFDGDVTLTAWARGAEGLACRPQPLAPDLQVEAETWRALRCDIAGRVARSGAQGVLLALEPGPDTVLLARLAVEALGPGLVRGLHLPDAGTPAAEAAALEEMARALRIAWDSRPIGPVESSLGALVGPGADAARLRAGIRALALATRAETLGLLPLVAHPGAGAGEGGHAPLAGLDSATVEALHRWCRDAAASPSPFDPEPDA